MAQGPSKERTYSEGDWKTQAHDAVFDALEAGLAGMEFPAQRKDILRVAGGVRVSRQPDVTLRSFLETLPERTYHDEDEVATVLNDTWSRARDAP